MTQLQKQLISPPITYLNDLLEKNARSSSKAQQYVAIKTVTISQKLESGQQLISQQQSQIKIQKQTKYPLQNDKRKIQAQKQKIQKKILLIQNQITRTEQNEKKIGTKKISEEQRLKFVKEKLKQNKQIAKRKQQYQKQLEQREKQIQRKLQEEQEKKIQQAKQKKLQQTKKKLQIIQKRKQQRVMQNKKANQILKQKSKQKILADKIQQKFLSNQNLLLDERKKKLAQLRQIHRPMDKAQLDQHMKKFQNSRLQRSRKKQSQKPANISSQKMNLYYRSQFHDILQRQKKQKQARQIQHQETIKQLKDRSKKYAEQIKVNYKPQIDQEKRKQIQKRIKSSSFILNRNDIDGKMKGMEYLSFTKQYAMKNKKQQAQSPKNQKLLRKQANRTQHTNYLAEIRKNNQQSRLKRSVSSAQQFIKNVQRKDIPIRQKHQKIISFAQNLQRKARQKQRLMKGGTHELFDEEVDKLYINAIQAKIKALQI